MCDIELWANFAVTASLCMKWKELTGECDHECVYLYFNPNDRRLAELEGRDVWHARLVGQVAEMQSSASLVRALEQPSRVFQRSGSFFGLRIPQLLRARCIHRLG